MPRASLASYVFCAALLLAYAVLRYLLRPSLLLLLWLAAGERRAGRGHLADPLADWLG